MLIGVAGCLYCCCMCLIICCIVRRKKDDDDDDDFGKPLDSWRNDEPDSYAPPERKASGTTTAAAQDEFESTRYGGRAGNGAIGGDDDDSSGDLAYTPPPAAAATVTAAPAKARHTSPVQEELQILDEIDEFGGDDDGLAYDFDAEDGGAPNVADEWAELDDIATDTYKTLGDDW